MFKTKLFALTLLALGQSAVSQPIGAVSPIQQIPPAQIPQRSSPETRVERSPAATPPVTEGSEILVASLQILGHTLYSESELLAAAGFRPQSKLTITALRAMASKVANFYRARGYLVAQAYLPAQNIKNGAVSIVVIEGRYGSIALRNNSTLSNTVVDNLLRNLKHDEPVASDALERSLLLLSDIPGVEVSSTLQPGSSPGSSDLIVDIAPGQSITGSVEVDNQGNRYTGENRLGVTASFNNPTGRGDVATLRGLTSGDGLNYLRGSYQAPLGDATAGLALAVMQYRLGREFESLQANGTVGIASLYGSYPVIRSRRKNVYITVDYDDKTFRDNVVSTHSVTDKRSRALMAGLNGNLQDNWGAGGFTHYALAWTGGELDIQTPAALLQDSTSVRSNGHFNKLAFSLTREQSLGGPVSLFVSAKGQLASKNLDVSEKMGLGGAYAVRAYPEGEAYADEGFVLNLESRYALPRTFRGWPGQMQLMGFVDTGTVTLNKTPWVVGPNQRTLSAIGIGVTWAENRNFLVKAYYAHKLGGEVATSAPDAFARLWLQAIKYF